MLYIYTLNWNGKNDLEELYPGLYEATRGFRDASWWVRDNGSKDDSIEWLSKNTKANILNINHNRDSFAAGVNSLWRASKPSDKDMILLLNNDIVISGKDSISKMGDLMAKSNSNIVGARLLYKGTNKLQHAGVIFSRKYNNLPFHFRPNEESDNAAEKDRWFQAVTAAFCLVKASEFNRINGLDEGYVWAFEDIDMCLQIGKVAYCGGTEIYHEESASLKKNPVNKMFMNKNVTVFRNKWEGKYDIDHDKYLSNSNFNEIK